MCQYVHCVHELSAHRGRRYYITAAPQCPFPDAYIGAALNEASFDAVYVQFYNNYCGLNNFNNPNDWNFATWYIVVPKIFIDEILTVS